MMVFAKFGSKLFGVLCHCLNVLEIFSNWMQQKKIENAAKFFTFDETPLSLSLWFSWCMCWFSLSRNLTCSWSLVTAAAHLVSLRWSSSFRWDSFWMRWRDVKFMHFSAEFASWSKSTTNGCYFKYRFHMKKNMKIN